MSNPGTPPFGTAVDMANNQKPPQIFINIGMLFSVIVAIIFVIGIIWHCSKTEEVEETAESDENKCWSGTTVMNFTGLISSLIVFTSLLLHTYRARKSM